MDVSGPVKNKEHKCIAVSFLWLDKEKEQKKER